MKKTSYLAAVIILAMFCVAGPSRVAAESVQEQRDDIRQLADNTLSQLYQMVPECTEGGSGLSRLWGFQRPWHENLHVRIRGGQGGGHKQRHEKGDLHVHG